MLRTVRMSFWRCSGALRNPLAPIRNAMQILAKKHVLTVSLPPQDVEVQGDPRAPGSGRVESLNNSSSFVCRLAGNVPATCSSPQESRGHPRTHPRDQHSTWSLGPNTGTGRAERTCLRQAGTKVPPSVVGQAGSAAKPRTRRGREKQTELIINVRSAYQGDAPSSFPKRRLRCPASSVGIFWQGPPRSPQARPQHSSGPGRLRPTTSRLSRSGARRAHRSLARQTPLARPRTSTGSRRRRRTTARCPT